MCKKFTLIEMLVIIAIIALLMTILMPSLVRARDTAKKAICINNLKQIGTLSVLYAADGDEHYPPRCAPENSTWDDYLSKYDGRSLTSAQMLSNSGFKIDGSDYPNDKSVRGIATKTYHCPMDERELNVFPRTYAINNHGWGNMEGIASGVNRYSVKIIEVEDPSGTIYIAPRPKNNNKLGRQGRADVTKAGNVYEDMLDKGKTGLHGNYKYSFLFADFHVRILDVRTTCSNPAALSGGDGMWTRAAGD